MASVTAVKPILSAGDFLAAIQRQEEVFEIAGVGAVKIRGLSVSQAQAIMETYAENMQGSVVEVIGLGLVEPELEPEQLAQLRDAAPVPVMALFERILDLSALASNQEDAERAENLAGAGSSA
jgi:hypothetical protein